MSQITKSVIYNTANSPGQISILCIIGYAQLSITSIYVDGNMYEEQIRESFARILGTGIALKGKEIVCLTTVYDIQQNTDNTSVKMKVSGDNGVLNIPVLNLKAKPGEVVFYKISILVI
jgi:hypothetical protein